MVDNYDLFCQHEAEKLREEKEWLKRCPKCADCDKPITDDECYKIGEELYCAECVDGYKVHTENYMKG